MTATKDELTTFAGLLDEFVAAQRAAAIGDTRKQRITVGRHVGDMNIAYELVVDEGEEAGSIYDKLAPLDAAIDRLKAKADLSDHYSRIANHVGQIEMAINKMETEKVEFSRKNAKDNETRRTPVVFTKTQSDVLNAQRVAIEDSFARIAELRKSAEECRRVMGGEDPFTVLDTQISARLDLLRAARQTAA